MSEIIWDLIRIKRKALPFIKMGNIPFLGNIPNSLQKYLRKTPVNVQGHKMFLDKLDTLQLGINRIYEPEMTDFFIKHILPGDTVLDIGAHIGYYSLLFADKVGKSGMVYSFEPDPSNFSILSKNIEINEFSNIKLINKALSDKSGEINLYESEKNSGDHRIYDSGEQRKCVHIEAIRLDDMKNDIKKPIKLIKMDIQGAEYFAVNGMISTIKNSNALILCTEFWPYGLKMSGANPTKFIELLLDLEFCLFEHKLTNIVKVDSVSDLIDRYRADEPSSYTNLLCIKGDKNL